jgi:hypothetical protein
MSKGVYISFCNKKAFNIIDDSFKESVLDSLKKNYYITIKDRNFYIINSSNIKYIGNNPYILSVKSIGSLYYLFLTKIDGVKHCIFIDRKVKEGHSYPRMMSVIYRFDDELFNETLFDGEIVKTEDDDWFYIINNLVLYKGELMKNKNIIVKINQVYDILTNNYIKDDHIEICPLYVKRLFGYHEWDYVIREYIPSLKYKTRGLYFEGIRNLKNHLYLFQKHQTFTKMASNVVVSNTTADEEPEHKIKVNKGKVSKSQYQRNKNQEKIEEVMKTKNMEEIKSRDTMAFMVRKTDTSDIFNLYCFENDDIRKYGIALIDGLRTSKKVNKLFRDGKDNITMNCKYSKDKEKWIPVEISDGNMDSLDSINYFISVQ